MKKKLTLKILFLLALQIIPLKIFAKETSTLKIMKEGESYRVEYGTKKQPLMVSPEEGLWSIATDWQDDWCCNWRHASPQKMEESGDWKILTGEMVLPQGTWVLRDAYRQEKGKIKCVRRFEWKGKETLEKITLSVRWNVPGKKAQAFLPGILYYGNPSGERNGKEKVPVYHGDPGEMAIFEDHRYAMPFACLEWQNDAKRYGSVLHTLPSPAKGTILNDHWWSMGVIAHEDHSELLLLSGPVTYNRQKSVSKALQGRPMKYGNTFLNIAPGTIIEKTFYLEAFPIKEEGTAFQQPLYTSIDIFKPFYLENLPSYHEILNQKYRFAQSRWIEGDGYAGYNMYPAFAKPNIVMGWCGQAASLGYAWQRLHCSLDDPSLLKKVQKSLDNLAKAPVSKEGFPVRFDPETKKWSAPDPVSQGQAMYNFAKAIEAARGNEKLNTKSWEEFLKKSCDAHAQRILSKKWNPRSTAEGFYIAPLCIAAKLFSNPTYKKAAIKATEHFGKRHVSIREPYWGGTLDATCEDKEGAWAAFQGFLATYELTGKKKYLYWAKHACDVVLSYVVVWDIPLPPGRMADHNFKSRGWTVVSPQNQHIDVYGVLCAPSVYKMGLLLENESLKRVAKVMYRSCGQLIDPFGSQGEQLQQTNFAQHGNMSDVHLLRGGYSEPWTVFWITAHFLNAAAQFEEMNVKL